MIMQLLLLYWVCVRIGLAGFGAGTSIYPLMERELVWNYGWLTPAELADNIALGSMTPGPLSVDTMALNGFRIAGPLGSIAAVAGQLTPSVVLLAAVIFLLRRFARATLLRRIQRAVQPGALGLMFLAVYTVARGRIGPVIAELPQPGSVPRLISVLAIAVITLVLFIWKREKFFPPLVILAMGLIGVLLFSSVLSKSPF